MMKDNGFSKGLKSTKCCNISFPDFALPDPIRPLENQLSFSSSSVHSSVRPPESPWCSESGAVRAMQCSAVHCSAVQAGSAGQAAVGPPALRRS
jgi:hypothetical protein